MKKPSFDPLHATENQNRVLATYKEYVRDYEDQEENLKNGTYVSRVATALSKFPNLISLTMDDSAPKTPDYSVAVGRCNKSSTIRSDPTTF